MTSYSILKFVNLLKEIVDDSMELNNFGWGFDFDASNQKNTDKYPAMWAQPVNTQSILGRNNNSVRRVFRLYVYDLERNDEVNRGQIWNQMELILLDVIRIFNYGSNDYKITNSPILVPFQETWADNVTGYWAELIVETSELLGDCGIPKK